MNSETSESFHGVLKGYWLHNTFKRLERFEAVSKIFKRLKKICHRGLLISMLNPKGQNGSKRFQSCQKGSQKCQRGSKGSKRAEVGPNIQNNPSGSKMSLSLRAPNFH